MFWNRLHEPGLLTAPPEPARTVLLAHGCALRMLLEWRGCRAWATDTYREQDPRTTALDHVP